MTVKIAVSLPDELVDQARAAVRDGSAPSVSAYVAQAMQEHAQRQGLRTVLADWDAELGAPSDATMHWADEVLKAKRADS